MMTTQQPILCRYRLTCQRCRRTWDRVYEVLTYHDLDGDRQAYFLHGAPAMPPWSGIACPHCGGLRVKVLPATAQP